MARRGFSPAYLAYMRGPRWRAAKERHWSARFTLKSCVVCGARRGEKALDMHHLAYGKRRDGEMRDPRRYELVPACARPCHRWLITPLSHWPFVRGALFVATAVLALHLGAPAVPTALATGGAILLPRIPEATLLCAALGMPVRLLRAIVRVAR